MTTCLYILLPNATLANLKTTYIHVPKKCGHILSVGGERVTVGQQTLNEVKRLNCSLLITGSDARIVQAELDNLSNLLFVQNGYGDYCNKLLRPKLDKYIEATIIQEDAFMLNQEMIFMHQTGNLVNPLTGETRHLGDAQKKLLFEFSKFGDVWITSKDLASKMVGNVEEVRLEYPKVRVECSKGNFTLLPGSSDVIDDNGYVVGYMRLDKHGLTVERNLVLLNERALPEKNEVVYTDEEVVIKPDYVFG